MTPRTRKYIQEKNDERKWRRFCRMVARQDAIEERRLFLQRALQTHDAIMSLYRHYLNTFKTP